MSGQTIYRQEIVRYGKLLYDLGYVAATNGNISVRLDDSRLLITPTGICKGGMSPEDLLIVDIHGRKLEGERNVSSEIAMHLLIYGMRPEVRGIVHAHPPTATGFAAAGLALDQPLLSEVLLTIGTVPLARYATPGSAALADTLQPLVANHNAILMANHGVVTFGEDLERAFMYMEVVEHFAKIALVTRLIGKQQLLSPDEISELEAIRKHGESVRAESGN